MIILIHVIIALLSIASATFGYIRPTNKNLRLSYALIALTFISGFYLVWSEPTAMLRTCLSGIAYLTVVSVGVFLTRQKMSLVRDEQAHAHEMAE